MQVLDQFLDTKIVPVVVLEDAADAAPLAEAMVDGGIPIAEVTFRTSAAAESIRIMAQNERMLVGAGTVLTPDQVDQAVDAGAQFLVSPGTSLAVINRAKERGVPLIPGGVTATEITTLLELGFEVVKFFPAEISGGVAAIKALSAPFRNVRFVPTGGIGLANVQDYLDVPSVVAVGGSWMVPGKLVSEGDFAAISQLCKDAVVAVK